MAQLLAEGDTNENGDVMGPNGHFLTKCRECPDPDDHPKIHYGRDTYHHDCLPPFAEQDVTRHADSHPVHARTQEIIAACRNGKKGSELRAHIADTHPAFVKKLEAFHASQGLVSIPLADVNAMHKANVEAGLDALAIQGS